MGVRYVIWRRKKHNRRTIINMSLGGAPSDLIDGEVNEAYKAGIYVVVAAGNEHQNACRRSPARAPTAITVGASDFNDDREYFSNYGPCVDVFAPGFNILTTYKPPQMIESHTGTSVAAAHVSGVLAVLYSQKPGLYANVANGIADFLAVTTKGKIIDVGGSPNRVAYLNLNNLPASVASELLSDQQASSESASTPESTANPLPLVFAFAAIGVLVTAAMVYKIVKRRSAKGEEADTLVQQDNGVSATDLASSQA
jgi:subtilisin family serine protease